MLRASLLIALAACTAAPPSDDVVGPFTGRTHRFVIDRFELPLNNNASRTFADDLDGDGIVDNQLGTVIATLALQGHTTSHAGDMIAAGSLSSIVEIQADDLTDDSSVAVAYYGAAGDPATPVGGALVNGAFVSNRTRSTLVPGTATLRLPVFADADPATIELIAMQLALTPDGIGGYDGVVQGAVRRPDAMTAAFDGVTQMFEARPQSHVDFWSLVDDNRDGIVTFAEFGDDGGVMGSLLATDLELAGHEEPLLSVGFKIHLAACASGRCAPAIAIDRCFDRVIDGDESGIDCGGSCSDCPSRGTCRTGADCQSGACTGGLCGPPTCSDGIHNGFEAGADCGGPCAPACP